MAVGVEGGTALRTDVARPLFSGRFHLCDPPRRHYDVGPDGRFVVVSQRMIATTPRQLVVQEGWSAADPAGKAGAAKR